MHAVLRGRQADQPRYSGGDSRLYRKDGRHHRQKVRRSRKSSARFRAFGRESFHARHDGHHSQPRPQRDRRRSHRQEIGQSPLGVGLLQKIYPDVFRRRHGGRQEVFRTAHRSDEGEKRRYAGRRIDGGRSQGARFSVQGRI